MQYPIVEALSAILCVIVAMRFGVTWQTIAGCFLTYTLIVQSTIDFRHTIIPDEITLPMIWVGLLLSIPVIFVAPQTAIIGAVGGYLFLWCIYWFFYWTTKKEGMGYGDFKLLAMLGAWIGWEMLPFIVLCSSILGSIIGIGFVLTKKKTLDRRIPFGPFLAIAGWIALIAGDAINTWYLQFAGFI
jgi:leader peptidase (prepilin peptidase)/N-methyltransferase